LAEADGVEPLSLFRQTIPCVRFFYRGTPTPVRIACIFYSAPRKSVKPFALALCH
jgi:hypothetical protein